VPEEFYRLQMRQILDMKLSQAETMAEIIAALAMGLDQLREEIQDVKDLIIPEEDE